VVRWQTEREWRTAQFFVTVEEIVLQQGIRVEGGTPLELSLPAAGNRHQTASYTVAHTSARPDASYRYTLRVRWWDGSETTLRTLEDGPETRTHLPVVR
jgi:hypothetical protein